MISIKAEEARRLAGFQEQREAFARAAVVFSQHTFGLVPEVLDAVNMIAARVDKGFAVVDPAVAKLRYINKPPELDRLRRIIERLPGIQLMAQDGGCRLFRAGG